MNRYFLDAEVWNEAAIEARTLDLFQHATKTWPRPMQAEEKDLMRFIDRDEVARRLTYDVCIPIVRDAMIAFSRGETKQLLRSIIPLSEGRLFGIMPGALGARAPLARS